MAQIETQSMPRNQFLTIAVNLLHKAFMEAARTDAKNLFKAVAQGRRVALTRLAMEDESTVRFDLALDHSAYQGSLNFSAFRTSLRTLLGNLATALREERDIATFGAEGSDSNMIFGIAGVTREEGTPAVLALGADLGGRDAAVLLKLMYLDYSQFERSRAEEAAAGSPAEPA